MVIVNNKVEIFSRFLTGIEIYTDRPVEVYIDQFTFDPKPKDGIRIIVLAEPLRDTWYHLVEDFPEYYDYVFTFDEKILATHPRAIHFNGMELWSKDYSLGKKRFAVSTVVGGKNDARMKGYALRHEVWRNQEQITIPREFYLSDSYKWKEVDYTTGTVLYGSKAKMFDCMFHIAIENTSVKNYYSEKLLDCFNSHTIPIYYGCTNVHEFFNIFGMFVVKNIKELIKVCNSLTPEIYEGMRPAMEDNYNRVKYLPSYGLQLQKVLIDLLKTL
jgi:hypothetical protein